MITKPGVGAIRWLLLDSLACNPNPRSRSPGWSSATARRPRWTVSTCASTGAPSPPCSAPTAAGKTTTVETCEGYRRPDAGTVRVLGLDPVSQNAELRPRIGVMLQSGGVYAGARAVEMLRHTAKLHADPLDVDALVERLGLGSCGRTAYPCGSPAASSSGSPWRWPWSAAPNWSSWTSPPPDSTRRPAAPPGSWSATCAGTASPWSSPPTTWTRPSSSPTGSRSSTGAG